MQNNFLMDLEKAKSSLDAEGPDHYNILLLFYMTFLLHSEKYPP